MPGKDLSDHQKSVISGYYAHLDTIMLAKLSELVGELYLAQTPDRKSQLWKRAEKAMLRLKIAPAIIRHIIECKDPQILAKNLQDWLIADNKKR
ncbi:MAG: hypothetical protein JXN61_14365 [Sedimentisphaerales bacterium]|nr:hypothetical protein [Sedimentisphaerales bacterium]